MPSSHLILCRPLLLLPQIPHQHQRKDSSFPMSQLFAWGGQSTGVSALASFPPKKIPGLISFRIDWLDLLAVQGTLKSLLQHHSSKASILLSSAFFTVQLSHPYMTTGKTIALTRWTFVGKVMSLLLNMLSPIGYIYKFKVLSITYCSQSHKSKESLEFFTLPNKEISQIN